MNIPLFSCSPCDPDSLYMDQCELTTEYYEFCRKTGHKFPEFWGWISKIRTRLSRSSGGGVTQSDATLMPNGLENVLPTEAEWEYAARGGLEGIAYPYGEKADHNEARFNDPEAEKGLC